MKPIPPPWMIEHMRRQGEEHAERERARLEIPGASPHRDARDQPPIAENEITSEPGA